MERTGGEAEAVRSVGKAVEEWGDERGRGRGSGRDVLFWSAKGWEIRLSAAAEGVIVVCEAASVEVGQEVAVLEDDDKDGGDEGDDDGDVDRLLNGAGIMFTVVVPLCRQPLEVPVLLFML